MNERKKINVGVICKENPYDRRPQSGTTFQVFKALSRQNDLNVFWIPFNDSFLSKFWLNFQKLISKALRITMPGDRSPLYIRLKEYSIDKEMLSKADVLYCPFTQLISVEKPTVYMSDALYHSMINYYWKADVEARLVKIGDRTQQLVLDHATKIVLPSQWAIDSALGYYHQSQNKVSLAEYGPNIDEKDIVPHRWSYDEHLHILFLGVDWQRKGGIKAVEACRWLNENGVKSTLHIVGTPNLDERIKELDYVNYIGFLNKNDRKQYECLKGVIAQCHCMLLPTEAECAGIAFCESTANGLPCFSYHTGGIPNYVLNGKNGYLLSMSASGEDFGKKIKDCLVSGELERMSKTCLDVYNTVLNWNVWARKTAKALVQAINEYGNPILMKKNKF